MVDLVSTGDMTGFPGAPFAASVLRSAAESVRDECGWHIAPPVTETLKVRTVGPVAILPTLRIVSVSEVRDAKSGRVITGWCVDDESQTIRGLPHGRRVEVDLEHGHEACPPALLPAIADRAKAIAAGGYIRQESLGSRSVSYATGPDVGVGAADPLARYKLPPRP